MNPIHPHCGPWNAVDPKRSRDPVDRICQEHDNEYGKLQKKHNWITPYLFQSRADDRFIVDMSKQKGVIPKLYNGVFMLKSMIAPRLEEAFGLYPLKPTLINWYTLNIAPNSTFSKLRSIK